MVVDNAGKEHAGVYFGSFSTTIAPGQYNQVGLAMYELPNMILAWVLFLLRPRRAARAADAA